MSFTVNISSGKTVRSFLPQPAISVPNMRFLLVVSFFAKFQKVGFERSKAEKTDLRSIETVQKVASLPELQCSTKDIVTEACYDLLKLEYFDDLVDSVNPADNQKLIEQIKISTITFSKRKGYKQFFSLET